MQAYSDFRVNCYAQTVIDLVTCFCKKGCIAQCFIGKPLMMFALYPESANGMLRVLIQQLLERQYNSLKNVQNLLRSGLRRSLALRSPWPLSA